MYWLTGVWWALGQDFPLLPGENIEVLEPVVVVASAPLPAEANYHPLASETVDEETLQRIAQGTLGDTLGWQAGVSTSSYGQGASRPVIRGFDGYRVRILRDSVGTLDVSASSPDHGLPLEPLLLREVEILRGPAALQYGNSALGGAINSTSRSFATELPERQMSGAFETRFDSVSSGWTNAGYLDLKLGEFVLSATGSYRDAGDYRISGRARTRAYDHKFRPVVNDPATGMTVPIENPSGRLPNSFHQSSSYSLGLSWLPETVPVKASFAYSNFSSDFGLPYLFGGDANDLFGNSALEMEQDRIDFRLRYFADLPWLSQATLHFGYGDYRHNEIFSGRGKDAGLEYRDTRFEQEAWEARLDFEHAPTVWLRGVAGIQLLGRSLDPSFLAGAPNPDSRFFNRFETNNLGLFMNETATLGQFEVNAAFRWETQKIKDLSLQEFGFTREVDDQSISAILGGSWEREMIGPFDRLKVNLNGSFVERIPSEVERFAFWSNPAIQRFLIGGDLDGTPLRSEQALGVDLGLEADIENVEMHFNFFHYRIDDFIYLQDLAGIGNQAQYLQTDASFTGIEAQADWFLLEDGEREVTLSLMGDWMRATDRDQNNPLPRIPALRLGSRFEYLDGALQAGLEIRHVFEQDRVPGGGGAIQGELPTDSYTEINLDFAYDFQLAGDQTLTVFAQIRNLLDEDRRLHPSFLKDVAPLPGRNVMLGARLEF
jgi:iron complex outermembrane receptor protein